MAALYNNLKFLRFQNHLEAIRARQVLAPIHIRIKPTNHCNQDCWYCAYKVSNLQLGADMVEADVIPEDKMDEIIDDIVSMGVKAVTFSGGGEPLLYKNLPKVVQRLAENGVRVATLTNGINLKGRMAKAFAQYGTWVRISIDAWDGPSYAKARSIKENDFDQVVKNMRDFVNLGTECVLGISFIITPENHSHLVEACTTFKEAGVNHVKVSAVVVDNTGKGNNEYLASIKENVSEQIKIAQQLNDDHFTIINHYHETNESFDKEYTLCPFLQYLTVIGADQGVYTCQDKAYTKGGLLGSIKERSFKDFWFSEENRQRIFSLDPSQECGHRCVAHGKNQAILEFLDVDPNHGLFV